MRQKCDVKHARLEGPSLLGATERWGRRRRHLRTKNGNERMHRPRAVGRRAIVGTRRASDKVVAAWMNASNDPGARPEIAPEAARRRPSEGR